jgi:hypothetical protein
MVRYAIANTPYLRELNDSRRTRFYFYPGLLRLIGAIHELLLLVGASARVISYLIHDL